MCILGVVIPIAFSPVLLALAVAKTIFDFLCHGTKIFKGDD
jgi:hypothetical protein